MDKCDGAIPPAWRNQRNPTGCDTPTPIAASSLEKPAATNAQNRRRCSCRATGGRPGDLSLPRKARSERRRPAIAPPSNPVLRRPFESTLNSAIRVMYQSSAGALMLDGHHQRRGRQLRPQVVAHRPSHDFARVQVHDGGDIQPALACCDVGQIRQPDLVRLGCGCELPVQQVGGNREGVAAVGGLHALAPGHKAAHAMPAHQALDAAAPHLPPVRPQGGVHARATIPAATALVRPSYVVEQRAILGRALASGPGPPGIVACCGKAEDAAQFVDRPGAAAVLDHAEPHFSGPAKIEMDFFKMSRSMRSRSHSRRSRAISAAWSAVGTGSSLNEGAGSRAASTSPPPAPYCRTHRHSNVGCRPTSAATAVAVRPLLATRSTTWRL